MISYRLALWLLALSIVCGIIGFTDLAKHAADISRTLSLVFLLALVAGTWHRLLKTRNLREPSPTWSDTREEEEVSPTKKTAIR